MHGPNGVKDWMKNKKTSSQQDDHDKDNDRMVKINELLKMIEAQEKAGGESCTPGTELELGENIVDSYGKVTFIQLKLG